MLHLIAERHGPQLASEIADQILHYPIRLGESPQRHTMGAATDELHPDVKAAIAADRGAHRRTVAGATDRGPAGHLAAPDRAAIPAPPRVLGRPVQSASQAAVRPGAADQHADVHSRGVGRLRLQLPVLLLAGVLQVLRAPAERVSPGVARDRSGPILAGDPILVRGACPARSSAQAPRHPAPDPRSWTASSGPEGGGSRRR